MGKVALVHDFLFTYGGAERVLSALHEMYPEAPIYTALADPAVVREHFSDADIRTSYLQHSWLRSKPALLLTAYPRAIESFSFSEYDTVISSSGAFSHGIITGPETCHICYCHTPMRYAWDYHAEYLKEKGIRNPLMRYLAERILSRLRTWDAVSALRVDYWIANSTVVKDRISRYYRTDSTVIYPPVSFPDLPERKPSRELKKAISISRLTPNKRIDLMIEACAQQGVELTVVGTGSDEKRLRALADQTGCSARFTGPVSEKDKFALIADSDIFLFAAEDDFGIAPVEAMGCGVPVLAYRKGGATETVVNGITGRFFNEPTRDSISDALDKMKAEIGEFDPSVIRRHAKSYSKDAFIKKVSEFVEVCQSA